MYVNSCKDRVQKERRALRTVVAIPREEEEEKGVEEWKRTEVTR